MTAVEVKESDEVESDEKGKMKEEKEERATAEGAYFIFKSERDSTQHRGNTDIPGKAVAAVST